MTYIHFEYLDVLIRDIKDKNDFKIIKDRPVRILPNGKYGVVYKGTVYPLKNGNEIYTKGEYFDKSICKKFVKINDKNYSHFLKTNNKGTLIHGSSIADNNEKAGGTSKSGKTKIKLTGKYRKH